MAKKKIKKEIKVLFVCTGNICRSPMAEIIFRNICEKHGRKNIIVDSAGTGAAWKELMTPDAVDALKACGEKVPGGYRENKRWADEMLEQFDHIVCMARSHARAIDFDGKHRNVYTLDKVCGGGDVFDPWCFPLDTYIDVCRRLQEDLEVLYNTIIIGD